MDNFRRLRSSLRLALCLLGLSAAGNLYAATSNPVAPQPTSTGTVDVSVTVGELVWIQNLNPIALAHTPGVDAIQNEPFCIYSTTGAFDITISSLTPSGTTAFTATGQAVPGNTVQYGVKFDTDIDASDGVDVTEAGTLVNNTPVATGVPPDCSTNNAAIQVTFPDAGNLGTAAADTYLDQLTLFVEPF